MTVVSAFGLISFCGVIESTALVVKGHALAHKTLRAGEAHAALVGQELAHGPNPAAAQWSMSSTTPSPRLRRTRYLVATMISSEVRIRPSRLASGRASGLIL